MKETTGDLWTFPAEYRVVTTNGVVSHGKLIMGAGVAKQAADRFPGLREKLAEFVDLYGSRTFLCKDEGIIALPTKTDWRLPSSMTLIHTSLWQMVKIVDKFQVKSVVMTRPGCGNGGLSWSEVKPLCVRLLDDRFTVVTP